MTAWLLLAQSGFGIAALVVGTARGFYYSRAGGRASYQIVSFLENAQRYHGAWSH